MARVCGTGGAIGKFYVYRIFVVAVIGQSGSGKSTRLNILGALDVPTGGRVLINGVDISTLDEDKLAILRSDEVGFVFQAHYCLTNLFSVCGSRRARRK